jgi:hypothetical protein
MNRSVAAKAVNTMTDGFPVWVAADDRRDDHADRPQLDQRLPPTR